MGAGWVQEQQAVWDGLWFVRLFRSGPVWLVHLFARIVTLVFLNRFVLWCAHWQLGRLPAVSRVGLPALHSDGHRGLCQLPVLRLTL